MSDRRRNAAKSGILLIIAAGLSVVSFKQPAFFIPLMVIIGFVLLIVWGQSLESLQGGGKAGGKKKGSKAAAARRRREEGRRRGGGEARRRRRRGKAGEPVLCIRYQTPMTPGWASTECSHAPSCRAARTRNPPNGAA